MAAKKVSYTVKKVLARGGRKSKNVIDERQKARGGTRLESFGIPLSEKQYSKRQRPKSGQALPKPKLDIGKASVKGIDKAMVVETRKRRARDARMALAIGTESKPAPKTSLDMFMRKLKTVHRTRVQKVKKGTRPKVDVAKLRKK